MVGSGPTHRLDQLLERDAELGRLDHAIAAAEAGGGSLMLIEGAAGVGKSTLLSHACDQATQQGFMVLTATGDELERSFALGVAIQLLREPVQRLGDDDPELVAGAAQLALPALERGALPPSASPNPAFPLFHGLHWLTAGLSERVPLLIAVDDAQWSDVLSLRFLLYLAQRAEALPVTVMLTVRTGEPLEPEAEGLLARLRDHPLTGSIALSGLAEASVRELVTRALPDADAVLSTAFFEASGGNPFLVSELLASAGEEGAVTAAGVARLHPEAIRNSILVRLGRLGEHAGKLAVAVAVLGPSASAPLAAELAGLDVKTASVVADSLVVAQVLTSGDPLAFVHPIVREVVYADIGPGRRSQEHAAAARLLQEASRSADEVAPHLLAAGPIGEPWTAGVLREAAAQALGRGAPAIAARFLSQALEESEPGDRPPVLLELGRAEIAAADSGALGHLKAAREAAPEPQARAVAAGALGQAQYALGDTDGAFESISEALEEIPPGEGGAAEAELLGYALAAARMAPDLVGEATRLLDRPRRGSAGEPAPAEIVRRSFRAFDALLRCERAAAAEELAWLQPKLAAAEIADAPPPFVQAMSGISMVMLGRYGEAQAVMDGAAEGATRRGNLFELGMGLETRAYNGWARGDVNACLADAETLLGLNEEGWEAATAATRALAADMLLERGDQAAAEEVLAPAEAVESRLRGTHSWSWLPYGRARLAFGAGAWKTALEQALVCGERLLAIRVSSPDYLHWRSLAARSAAQLGDLNRALSLAEEELELARSAGSPRASGVALASLGVIRGTDGGLGPLGEAVELLDSTEAELEPARARLELGMALRRARRPADARRPLEEALDTARRLGSIDLAKRALDELRAAGGRPRRTALSGAESLTPSERRVAELAAGGMSNREIAEALFVTRRTVETHLTHAYGKLEISSREQLPVALGMTQVPR